MTSVVMYRVEADACRTRSTRHAGSKANSCGKHCASRNQACLCCRQLHVLCNPYMSAITSTDAAASASIAGLAR